MGRLGAARLAAGELEKREVWPYSEDGKLIGEHIYEDISTRAFEKVDPPDVITPQRAAEIQKTLFARLEKEGL